MKEDFQAFLFLVPQELDDLDGLRARVGEVQSQSRSQNNVLILFSTISSCNFKERFLVDDNELVALVQAKKLLGLIRFDVCNLLCVTLDLNRVDFKYCIMLIRDVYEYLFLFTFGTAICLTRKFES